MRRPVKQFELSFQHRDTNIRLGARSRTMKQGVGLLRLPKEAPPRHDRARPTVVVFSVGASFPDVVTFKSTT
jgi:hypothetical protein